MNTTATDINYMKQALAEARKAFAEDEVPDDPLAREIVRWMHKENITNPAWNFTVFPSQHYKDQLGSALLKYAQGTLSWDEVKKVAVEEWKSEFGA